MSYQNADFTEAHLSRIAKALESIAESLVIANVQGHNNSKGIVDAINDSVYLSAGIDKTGSCSI